MKRLLLLRHAKAEPGTEPLTDIARPLAARGERDARHIAGRLHRQLGALDLILASPAARTLQTAEIVAAVFGYPRSAIALERALYLAEPTELIDVIAARGGSVDRLLVVGHNPGLTELAHALLPGFDVDDLATSAIVALDYEGIADWTAFADATPHLGYYDFPKNPGEPVTTR
jgi:phosphohistidine phosphatase